MNEDTLRNQVYLAALLHDIGKFYQQTDELEIEKSKILDKSVKDSQSLFCPINKSDYYHKHVLYTLQFIKKVKKKNSFLSEFSGEYNLEDLAGKHHKPSNFYEEIIQLANQLSSGLSRIGVNSNNLKVDTNNNSHRMVSVFEKLMKTGDDKYEYSLPIKEMCLTDSFFPQRNFSQAPNYKILWENFISDLENINVKSFFSFSENVYSLLYKYTCNIGSNIINLPDVSLFDHLKTTASIAICLYDYLKYYKITSFDKVKQKEKPFLLLGGDVSGIQKYIYDILSKSAAKNLKGRSFYVQLLVDTIITKLLYKLKLFSSNIIYSSGGGFFLLVPNTPYIKNIIKEESDFISHKIFNKHKVNLYFAIGSKEISIENIINKRINEDWKGLNEKLNVQKRQRYKHKFIEKYNYFFEPIGIGGERVCDAFSSEEFFNEQPQYYTDKEGLTLLIKPYTKQQINLGKLLKDTDYWIVSGEELDFIDSKESINICDLGIYNYFLNNDSFQKYKNKLSDYEDKIEIQSINNLQYYNNSNNIVHFYLYGGNKYPCNLDGTPLSFSELAGVGDLKRLGYLRMDVDNLGAIFAQGFSNNKCTFSRYSSLSRNLDFFFKGFINTIWRQEKFKQFSSIIYSGGDDLFLVGRWDVLIEMAEKIRESFSAWVCYNPNMSISGGIAIVDEKFPALKASFIAGDAEDQAKNHIIGTKPGEIKNAFSIFGMPLNWDTEYKWVKKVKNILVKYLDENRLPHSFISKLKMHFMNARIKNHVVTNLQIYWLLAYDFSRIKETIRKSDNEVIEFIENVKNSICTGKHFDLDNTKYNVFELINLSARWAELELRTK